MTTITETAPPPVIELDDVTIRFAGDSGDGIQLTGQQFTVTTAISGNDLSTLPDFPAEIRAPAGSLPGVSGFQINFSSHDIRTPGDEPNVLVAMNPAALKVNIGDLEPGGLLVVNEDAFTSGNLEKAAYKVNPLEDGSLSGYRVIRVPLSSLTANALSELGMSKKETERCKNFFALGIMYWLYDRPLDPTLDWIGKKFGKNPTVQNANTMALKAGYNYADTTEIFNEHYRVKKAELQPGFYRNITGNEATALGFVAAAQIAGLPLFYGSYPITPASDILHELSKLRHFGIRTFQAEDEIAAITATIGAAFTGSIGLTGTSGPGVALKSEAIGLAVMTELPLVIIDVQRGGPSTGLPTKTEQADLLQAMFGRNGECPVAVIAPGTPGECFSMAIEAVRIAVTHMLPVFFLSDGYLANGAEPWKVPAVSDLPKINVTFATGPNHEKGYMPFLRNPETLARPWAIPGTPGLEHRIGGIEKADVTGNVSYDPANHEHMVRTRAEKVARIANDVPDVEVFGDAEGDLLIVGWGGTHGAITSAVEKARKQGKKVSSIHLRYINPFPKNLGDVLKRFKKVMVAELNLGQLNLLIRSRFVIDTVGLNKVQGKPFKISEILKKIDEVLS
ncbi:MAG: 2-oxoacid:acceptor oxidoreductase subunit alpha [Proteobacteria bacterium]|nr:2-oxoacid:acceptor oxidoreductase subunit alpha [Pseudomonadota bacterium]